MFVGYIAGTVCTIILGQAKDLLAGGAPALVVGGISIAVVATLKWLVPRMPGPFVVLLLATTVSAGFGLEAHGVSVIGSGLGHFGALTLPTDLGWSDWKAMIVPAISLALIVYVDTLANGDMLAQRGDPEIDPRREYFALSVVNALSSVGGGFVAGCSTSRSLVAMRSGQKSRLTGAIAAVLLVLTALSIVKFLSPLPLPALSGVVLVAAIDLINVKGLREMWRLRRADFFIAVAAGAAVVLFGMIEGVLVGVAVALGEALRRAMYPDRMIFTSRLGASRYYEPFSSNAVHASQEVLVYRFGTGLFFGNADVFLRDMREIVRAAPPSLRTIVINADALGIPDASARAALVKARRELGEHGLELVFGNARAPVRKALQDLGELALIDEPRFVAVLRELHAPLTTEPPAAAGPPPDDAAAPPPSWH